jgi:hypothetical protein
MRYSRARAAECRRMLERNRSRLIQRLTDRYYQEPVRSPRRQHLFQLLLALCFGASLSTASRITRSGR